MRFANDHPNRQCHNRCLKYDPVCPRHRPDPPRRRLSPTRACTPLGTRAAAAAAVLPAIATASVSSSLASPPSSAGSATTPSIDRCPGVFHSQTFGSRGRLMLSDDDLAADLGSFYVKDGPSPSSSAHSPTRLPLPRCPRVAPPTHFQSHIPLLLWFVRFWSPALWLTSDSGLSVGGSPLRTYFEQQLMDMAQCFLPAPLRTYLSVELVGQLVARQTQVHQIYDSHNVPVIRNLLSSTSILAKRSAVPPSGR